MGKTSLINYGAKHHMYPVIPILEDRLPRLDEVLLQMALVDPPKPNATLSNLKHKQQELERGK